MEQQIKKFLEFNGKVIYFLAKDGQYWIAIKPICEALNLEYTRQFKNIKSDQILGQLLAEQPMVGADNRTRKMASLPEKYIYGWLFSIRSERKELIDYKQKCYEVLFDYFHGTIGNRKDLISVEAKIDVEIRKAARDLEKTPEHQNYIRLINEKKGVRSQLRQLDRTIYTEQLGLFAEN